MSGLEIDFETRSAIDLRKRGAYVYFASETTEPLMASYSIDSGPVRRWRPPAPCPADIVAHVEAGGMISAHNASFERLLWQMVLTPRYGWPKAALKQFRCTAATAAAMSLPRDLAGVGAALDLPLQKDKEGSALIRRFSIPRKANKKEQEQWYHHMNVCGGDIAAAKARAISFGHRTPLDFDSGLYFNDPQDFPAEFERFHDYCDRDVETEALADRRMVPLSEEEQELYWLDQRINDRGIRIDLRSARAALALADKAKAGLDREMRIATGGFVGKCSEPGKLVEWVKAQGIELNSAAKAEIEELLEDDSIPPHVRRAIEIRQEAAKTSVSKLKAMIDRAGADGRVRGSFLFCAAGTGRWSSLGVQLQNLPRPRKVFENEAPNPEVLFQTLRRGDPELLPLLYGDELGRPLHLVSDAIRGFIWAAPGHEFLQADYTGIEGAVAAWSAGEDWKVQALFDIIADPSLPDLYRRTAAGIMNTTTDIITKKHPLRQSVGKVSELSLGYQGGVAAFYSMSRNYGVKLDPLFGPVWETATQERRDKAMQRYEKCLRRGDSKTDVLSREAWVACELIKVGWRASNPAIAASWSALESAMREAVGEPGKKVAVLNVEYLVARGFLWCRLPSGRCLAYGGPKLRDQVWAKQMMPDGSWSEDSEVLDRELAERLAVKGLCRIDGKTSPKVTALGVNSVTKKWERFGLYGGLAFENCLGERTEVLTQAGWKPIVNVTKEDLLWDGLEWVDHDGLVFQGFRNTINFAGVRMTPDHKVWTDDGWKRAEDANIHAAETASPDPEYDGRALRPAGYNWLRRWGREEKLVVGPMRLRHDETVRWFGAPQGQNQQLRLLGARTGSGAFHDPRHVWSSGLCRLEQHGRSMLSRFAQSIPEIWRSWTSGLRSVAEVLDLLAGHGRLVGTGADLGAVGQREGLRANELRLENQESPSTEHAFERFYRHAARAYDVVRRGRVFRFERDDARLPSEARLARGSHVRRAGQHPENSEPVFDLLNAGPRHRFTVRGENGPIIVSNCVQAIARDLLANGLRKAESGGYPVVAHVHDEILTEVPRGWGDVKAFEKLICELPEWAAGLPLTADGWRGKRYRK